MGEYGVVSLRLATDSLFLPARRFIKGKEYRVGVIETGPAEYMMLPVMDYMMEEEQVRDLEYKLDLNNRGIPTGAC